MLISLHSPGAERFRPEQLGPIPPPFDPVSPASLPGRIVPPAERAGLLAPYRSCLGEMARQAGRPMRQVGRYTLLEAAVLPPAPPDAPEVTSGGLWLRDKAAVPRPLAEREAALRAFLRSMGRAALPTIVLHPTDPEGQAAARRRMALQSPQDHEALARQNVTDHMRALLDLSQDAISRQWGVNFWHYAIYADPDEAKPQARLFARVGPNSPLRFASPRYLPDPPHPRTAFDQREEVACEQEGVAIWMDVEEGSATPERETLLEFAADIVDRLPGIADQLRALGAPPTWMSIRLSAAPTREVCCYTRPNLTSTEPCSGCDFGKQVADGRFRADQAEG
jgi:hypothetical protein